MSGAGVLKMSGAGEYSECKKCYSTSNVIYPKRKAKTLFASQNGFCFSVNTNGAAKLRFAPPGYRKIFT